MNERLYEQIKAYLPVNAQEKNDQIILLNAIKTYDDILYRENKTAHFCASPWIMNQTMDQVLFVYHNIYRSWGWCGGHADGCENLLETALKEGKEETGLNNLFAYDAEILGIDVLPVPKHLKNGKVIAPHLHFNVSFLCFAYERESIHIKPDENSAIGWFYTHEIENIVSESHMIPIYQKLMQSSRKHMK